MTKKLEIERRWLIKLPLTKEAQDAVEAEHDVPARIVQTYLNSNDGAVHRVRCIDYDFWGAKQPAHFVHTAKRLVEMGVNEEDEHSLTEIEYREKLADRDIDTIDIQKTRYHLHNGGHVWELDLYSGAWEGLAILECELKSLDEEFEIPPYLLGNIDREITKEKGWSNADLAHRYSNPQGVWFGQPGLALEDLTDLEDIPNDDESIWQPKSWFSRLINWLRPEARYDERNERIYGDQINEEAE